ncbi:hypothetical protein [Alterinioella nitratireducens]|uniref:hypothetical protein n=1 Tax=Alterinioella nitratireducens TaxID=2735915 RepID=UPI0015526D9E|nr:hypothetical protein [Alterinioella nitratireducens]NPD20788.1 hypothetical protein [Alterinioella nitratireducens]
MENLFRGKSGRSLFVLLCLAAYLIGISPHLIHWFTAGSPPDALVWNMTHYHVSYPEYGFLRRGLLGTAMAPLLAPLTDGGGAEYAVMLGLDLGLMLALIWLAMRFFLREDGVPGQGWILAALILSPVGFVQLGYDAGRLDHVNFVLAAIAVLCALRGWSIAAGALMLVAVLVHEAALFYAVPVVTVLAWRIRFRLRDAWVAALPPLAAALALVIWGGTEADLSATLPEEVALAASVWTRDLLEPARGFPPVHYLIAAYFAAVPLFLLWTHYRLARTRPDLLFLAPFAALALFALGVDYGRWSQLVFFAVLLVIAAGPPLGRARGMDLDPLPARAVILPWLLPLGPIGIAVLYPFIPWVV